MKRKILIVEDNISLSQMQKDWFAQAGYDVVTAMNEPIARSLIRKIQFDLILSDVRLPEGTEYLYWNGCARKERIFLSSSRPSMCRFPMWCALLSWER